MIVEVKETTYIKLQPWVLAQKNGVSYFILATFFTEHFKVCKRDLRG